MCACSTSSSTVSPRNKCSPGPGERFGSRAAIGTSFQGAGLVMMHLAKQNGIQFPVFTLDTGLLFPGNARTQKTPGGFFRFSNRIAASRPDCRAAGGSAGPRTLEARTGPLLHHPQSPAAPRQAAATSIAGSPASAASNPIPAPDIGIIELYHLDQAAGRDIVKLNPMAEWSRDAVWKYIQRPQNPLQSAARRRLSLHRLPALHRIKPASGDDERAGRWTGFNKVECGIHTFLSKKVDFQI